MCDDQNSIYRSDISNYIYTLFGLAWLSSLCFCAKRTREHHSGNKTINDPKLGFIFLAVTQIPGFAFHVLIILLQMRSRQVERPLWCRIVSMFLPSSSRQVLIGTTAWDLKMLIFCNILQHVSVLSWSHKMYIWNIEWRMVESRVVFLLELFLEFIYSSCMFLPHILYLSVVYVWLETSTPNNTIQSMLAGFQRENQGTLNLFGVSYSILF